MIKSMTLASIVFIMIGFSYSLQGQGAMNNSKFKAVAEIGFLGVLDHKIQFSNNGTYFDYVKDGGQDVLYPVSRLSLEYRLTKRSTVVLLYQPLKIESTELLSQDLIVDNETFTAGTPMKFLYNFPFYRFSYLNELLPNNNKYNFELGLSVQIRNATISFESLDGTQFRRTADIGIVPAIKVRTSRHYSNGIYLELEADGMYAPVSYLNGSDNEIVGAILDGSVRAGYKLQQNVSTFVNLRYLGGGAVGTDPDDDGPGDGYVRNWLNFLTVSGGFIYEFK